MFKNVSTFLRLFALAAAVVGGFSDLWAAGCSCLPPMMNGKTAIQGQDMDGNCVFISEARWVVEEADTANVLFPVREYVPVDWRYGSKTYTCNDIALDSSVISDLAYRKRVYKSGEFVARSWRDTVDYIFDIVLPISTGDNPWQSLVSKYDDESPYYKKSSCNLLPCARNNVGRNVFLPKDCKDADCKTITLPHGGTIPAMSDKTNLGHLSKYPPMEFYFEEFAKRLIEDMADDPDPPKKRSDEFFDFEGYMMEKVMGEFVDPTVYDLPYGNDYIRRWETDSTYGVHSRWRLLTNYISTTHGPQGNVIMDKYDPNKILSGRVTKFLDPGENVSYNIKGFYRQKPPLDSSKIISKMMVYYYLDKDGNRDTTLHFCSHCSNKGTGDIYQSNNGERVYVGQSHNYRLMCDVGDDGEQSDCGAILHEGDEGFAYLYNKNSEARNAANKTGGYYAQAVVTRELPEDSMYTMTRIVAGENKNKNEEVTIWREDYLFQYSTDISGYRFHYIPFFFWGWYNYNFYYDWIGNNGEEKCGSGLSGGNSYPEKECSGRVTNRILGNKPELFNYGSVSAGNEFALKSIFGDLENKYKTVVKDFKAEGYFGGRSPGESAAMYLKRHGFEFVMGEHPQSKWYLDSAWYFANPHTYEPYVDAYDFIVRNSYYQNDNEFVRLYMERSGSTRGNEKPLCGSAPDALQKLITDITNIPFGSDFLGALPTPLFHAPHKQFKTTWKWPLVYKNRLNDLYVIGYAIYEPDMIIWNPKRDEDTDELRAFRGGSGKRTFWAYDAPQLGDPRTVYSVGAGLISFGGRGYDINIRQMSPRGEFKCYKKGTGSIMDYPCQDPTYQIVGNIWVTMKEDETVCEHFTETSFDPLKFLSSGSSKVERFGFKEPTHWGKKSNEQNNYLTIIPIRDKERPSRSFVTGIPDSIYNIRDYITDQIDASDRGSWPSKVQKESMEKILELVLWGEGVNLLMKAMYEIGKNPGKYPGISKVALTAYGVAQRVENKKATKKTVSMVKSAWRVYKEIQETLELINNAKTTYKKIEDMWDGMNKAFDRIWHYYDDFDWSKIRLTNISKILPFSEMKSFDRALNKFHGSLISFNRAAHDLALYADTVGTLNPARQAMVDMYTVLLMSNVSEVDAELRSANDRMVETKDIAKDGGKRKGAAQGQLVSVLTGSTLLHLENIRFKTTSNGITALASVLDMVESEAQDWQKWNHYMTETFSRENLDEFGKNWRAANNKDELPDMEPVMKFFGTTPRVFRRNLDSRSSRAYDKDFWASPDAWDFFTVDDEIRRKYRNNKNIYGYRERR